MSKILFVCSGNKLRSPTAEVYFKDKGFDTKSAGTSNDAMVTINQEHIKWSDHIYFMEEKHYQRVYSKYPRSMQFKKTTILNIEDNYKLMDKELIKILSELKL